MAMPNYTKLTLVDTLAITTLLLLGISSSGFCCESWEFRCDNGDCVKGQAKCTDKPFCYDGSDTRLCLEPIVTPPPCQGHKFQCANGLCINQRWVCDKNDDCGDNSDERTCPTRGSSVLTQASVIGLSVAVVGLFAILVGVIFMVTCARRKMERERLERRRQITERHHDMMGPYAGYMIGQGMPEPPPRYSSQPDLSVSSSSFSPYPLCEVPPPLYSPRDKPTAARQPYEPPPTYTSYPDLRSALVEAQMERSESVVSQGLDNPGLDLQEESFEIVKSEDKSSRSDLNEPAVSRTGTLSDLSTATNTGAIGLKRSEPKIHNSKANLSFAGSNGVLGSQSKVSYLKKQSETSTSRRSSANSLYEGLTTADRDLLQNIMMTVPSEVLTRRGSSEAQSTVDLRPPRMDKDQYKSEPAVYMKRNEPKSPDSKRNPSQTKIQKSQAKSYSHLEMVHSLPPLRHAASQDTRYISSSELANPWNADSLHSFDFHAVQPACVSTPKQVSPRKLQMCSDINISQESLDMENDTNRGDQLDQNRHEIIHHQGASMC